MIALTPNYGNLGIVITETMRNGEDIGDSREVDTVTHAFASLELKGRTAYCLAIDMPSLLQLYLNLLHSPFSRIKLFVCIVIRFLALRMVVLRWRAFVSIRFRSYRSTSRPK
jgi:hypothetical protein